VLYGELPQAEKTVPVAVLYAVMRAGHEAVLVFFALSGFLVAGRAMENALSGKFSLASYTIDRATRILIPLAAACIFTAAVCAAKGGEWPRLTQVTANVFGLNGVLDGTLAYNDALWSLAYEIWFYILLGSLLQLMRGSVLSAAVLVVAIFVFTKLDIFYVILWLAGGCAYLARRKLDGLPHALLGSLLAGTGILLFQLQSDSHAFKFGTQFTARQAEAAIALGTALLLPALTTHASGMLLRPLDRISTFLSDISYSMYLTHLPVIALMAILIPVHESVQFSSLALLVLRIAVITAVAWGFYWLFERNSYKLRAQFKRWFAAEQTSGAVHVRH
jgi:peptidoglycan/LPS O-acetylase OafA/YrhL